MSSGLDGKVAIVTGATSGIGASTASALADAGAKVVVSGRSNAGAEATATAIAAAGGEARIVLGDLTDSAFSTELVTYAVDELGGVDVLVNGAGVIVRGDATVTTDDDWRHTMAVNVDAVFYLSRAVIPAMRKRGGGAIVNLASNVGLVGAAGLPAYCASKGAVVQLTRAMAIDHAAEGIRVNALCPGAVDTPMLEFGHRTERTRADILDANIAAIPEGRVATPDEVAQAVLFLASDQSRHITGVALPIDGGYVAR